MRLIDCFIELFYYSLFLDSLNFAQFSFENLRNHYKELIPRAREAANKAGFSRKEWEMGFFAVCAWIDEFILCSDWSEKEQWAHSPLQLVFYKTANAGEEFFIRLSGLGQNHKSVREVYDYCLALGYKGRYFQSQDAEKLKEIASANLKLLLENANLAFPETLFPKAYTFSFRQSKRMLRTWGLDLFTLLGVGLPVVLFIIIYSLFSNTLADIVSNYFKTGF
ncbi:MAG TPA: DotU family type IV/VI secretion system protein [archaeon]|nr:DotU family type IV/VI secretion system protein [archaeon]